MWRLLQLLFLGHIHKWIIIQHDDPLTIKYESGFTGYGSRYVLQCEHCGKLKQKDIE